jgi:glucosyl-3-phosphoglycerate synthase
VVPVIHGCDAPAALRSARALAPDVLLLGFVPVAEAEVLSAGAARAQEMRRRLRQLAEEGAGRTRARVRVTSTPWVELRQALDDEDPDLLLLEYPCQAEAFGDGLETFLTQSPCDVALVRGPLPEGPLRVLAPVRGGPHAELGLRLALSLAPAELLVLHLSPSAGEGRDAPFRGLRQVLRRLAGVHLRVETTDDPSTAILQAARDFDLIVLGTTARPDDGRVVLGPVAARLLQESPAAVMVVKTHRPMAASPSDEAAGAHAISILVDKWFAENTFAADEFAELNRLLELKQRQALTISLALPALNEEETVANVIRILRRALMERVPLVDEMVLMDSRSDDRTRDIARRLGIPVFVHQDLLPALGERSGKGEALWKSLWVTHGDVIVWVDTDIVNMHPRFVYGLLGPLLQDPRIQFVKGFYRRPLRVGDQIQAGAGGRVTELTARPLLNLFFPELSGIIQPLSGEYAGRRSILERLPFFSGYGVETGLLIDVFEQSGLGAIAQVDLLERIHHNQPLEALSKMSFAIIQAVIHKLESRYGRAMLEDVNKTMKLIRREHGEYFLEVEEVIERERPPMAEVPGYRTRGEASRS